MYSDPAYNFFCRPDLGLKLMQSSLVEKWSSRSGLSKR